MCWQLSGVAGAWGRPRRLGDAAGPAPRPLRAKLRINKAVPTAGTCAAGRSGWEPDCEFRALSKPLPRQVFSPRNAAFCKLGRGSLIHIPGTKPPLSFRPGGRARPGSAATRSGVEFTRSHTHGHKIPSTRWILITLRGLCPSSLAPNVPGPSVPVSWAHISAHVHLPFYFGCLRKGRSGVEVSDCFLGLTPLRAAPLLSLCACPTEKPRVCISFISWQCGR